MLTPAQDERLQRELHRLVSAAEEAAKAAAMRRDVTRRRHRRRGLDNDENDGDDGEGDAAYDDDYNDGNDNGEGEGDGNDDDASLRLVEEQYRRSWVYHRAYTCIYRRVFCPRVGCAFAKPLATTITGAANTNATNNGTSTVNGTGDVLTSTATGGATASTVVGAAEPRLPWHLLAHHLDHDCTGYEVQQRCVVIERARGRHPYPRPWGVSVTIPRHSDALAEAVASGAYAEEPITTSTAAATRSVTFGDAPDVTEFTIDGDNGGDDDGDDVGAHDGGNTSSADDSADDTGDSSADEGDRDDENGTDDDRDLDAAAHGPVDDDVGDDEEEDVLLDV